ncbi:MAG: DNA polymerase III subunit delta [Gammaproteobacteria bacterium]|nr:DNA polymerase III subunit delta [Gammaproteobacteria bacterium]MCW5582927.1 DNA polymerase III subunit delta [Gammaproteobacteria bacterium]
MKLTYFQLEPHLAKQLAPIYIISGDELLLKQDAIHLIRKAAKKTGFSERVRITPEAGFDWETLYSLLYSASLSTEQRLFELDFRDIAPNKIAGKILQEYGERPSPDNLLLIDIGKIDDKIAKTAWYKSLEKNGIVVTVWPIPREQLPQWIHHRAKKYKLQFNPHAANLLADYTEGNLVATAQTIEKIYLLQPQKPIDADLIETVLADESRFTVFDFVDALIARNQPKALRILESLKQESIEPVLILWGITRELRLLAQYAEQLSQGLTYEQLFQKQRIFPRRQPSVRHFLTTFTVKDCWRHLSHAAEIDRVIKGAEKGDIWMSLQIFCLRLG